MYLSTYLFIFTLYPTQGGNPRNVSPVRVYSGFCRRTNKHNENQLYMYMCVCVWRVCVQLLIRLLLLLLSVSTPITTANLVHMQKRTGRLPRGDGTVIFQFLLTKQDYAPITLWKVILHTFTPKCNLNNPLTYSRSTLCVTVGRYPRPPRRSRTLGSTRGDAGQISAFLCALSACKQTFLLLTRLG